MAPDYFFAEHEGITVTSLSQAIFQFNNLTQYGLPLNMNISIQGSIIASVTFTPNYLSMPFRLYYGGNVYSGYFSSLGVNF